MITADIPKMDFHKVGDWKSSDKDLRIMAHFELERRVVSFECTIVHAIPSGTS